MPIEHLLFMSNNFFFTLFFDQLYPGKVSVGQASCSDFGNILKSFEEFLSIS